MRKTSTTTHNLSKKNTYAATVFDVDQMYFDHYKKTSADMLQHYPKMDAEDKDWVKRLFTSLFRDRDDNETLQRLSHIQKFEQVRRLCGYDPFYSMLMTWLLFREIRVPEKRAQQKQKDRNQEKKKKKMERRKMTPEEKEALKEQMKKAREERKKKKEEGNDQDGEDQDGEGEDGEGEDGEGDGDGDGEGDDDGEEGEEGQPSNQAGKSSKKGKGVDETDGADADDIDPNDTSSFGFGEDLDLDEDLADELKKEIEDILSSARMEQDLEKAAQQEEMIRSFARNGDKEKNLLDAERIMQIYNRMNGNANFQKILNIMGGLMAAYGKALRQSYLAANNNIVNVVQGNDLRKLLNSEFQSLGHPKLARIAKAKFINKTLLQYEKQNNQDANRGPIALFMDVSGSMDAHFQGATRVEWAWAMLLAIAKISEDEGREVRVFTFDTTITEITFKDFRDLLLTGKYHTGGGTDIGNCFNGFWEKCGNKFDLVMLSDLEDNLDDSMKRKIIAARQSTDSKYHLFLINQQTSVSSQWMQAFNTVVPVTASPDAMEQFMVEATKKDNVI